MGDYDEDWPDLLSILQWYFNCTIAGCTIRQNNDTKLSMSIHDAVNGENVIADEQVFYWNMSDSESVSGTYQWNFFYISKDLELNCSLVPFYSFSVPNSDPSLIVTRNDSSGNLFLAFKSDSDSVDGFQSWVLKGWL